jgi:hypothetical protein
MHETVHIPPADCRSTGSGAGVHRNMQHQCLESHASGALHERNHDDADNRNLAPVYRGCPDAHCARPARRPGTVTPRHGADAGGSAASGIQTSSAAANRTRRPTATCLPHASAEQPSVGTSTMYAADLQRGDCVRDHRIVPRRSRLRHVRDSSAAALDRLDRLRRSGFVRVVGAIDICGPVDFTQFYNTGGWGPTLMANVPPAAWFVSPSIALFRRSRQAAADAPTSEPSG